MMRAALVLTLAALLSASPALADTTFVDNFDNEPAGPNQNGSTLNATNLTNFFTSAAEGTVDTVTSGAYGIICAGGAGKCIDLDGSTGNGGTLVSRTLFSYTVGDLVSLTFQISGNQRNAGNDLWFGGFFNQNNAFYGNPPPIMGSSFSGSNPCGSGTGGAFSTRSGTVNSSTTCQTLGNAPFTTYNLAFRAANSGNFRLVFGDYSTGISDSQGAILDNVRLSIAGVPEPMTWALMILGFGVIGGALRRRATLTPAFAP